MLAKITLSEYTKMMQAGKNKITYIDVIKFYLQQARVTGWKTPAIFLFRIIVLLTVIAEPWIIKNLLDVLNIGDYAQVRTYVWILGFLAVVEFVARRFIEYRIVQAQLLPMKQIATYSFEYIHRHGSEFFADNMSGSLLKKVKDGIFAFEELYDNVVFSLITPIGLTFGALVVLTIENKWLGIMMGIRVIILVGFQTIMYQKKGPMEELATKSRSKRSGYVADTFSNHATIEYAGNMDYEQELQQEKIEDRYDKNSKNWRFGNIIYGVTGFLMNALFVGGIVLCVRLWQQGNIGISVVVMFILYAQTLLNQLRGIGNIFKSMVKSMEDAKEFLALIQQEHSVHDLSGSKEMQIMSHDADILFDDVSFGYILDETLEIENFSLHIQSGEHIGLVGESGSGKSTLTKLLLRLYDLHNGIISIGGKSITGFTLDSLRSQISYVPQDPILFHRTLRQNILYGDPKASEQEMIDAAKRAQAHEFISQLSDGYDSMVGERGVKLSGGQRQRIAIARAILHDAPIIILDEATSSLDSVTEKSIQLAMQEVMKEKTAIVIAHRLGTVKHLDRIIVLKSGSIIEHGSHKDLLDKEGEYAQLRKHQV